MKKILESVNFKRKMVQVVLVLFILGNIGIQASAIDYGEELDPSTNTPSQTFSDVAPNYWAYQYIEDLVERGAIKGYPDGKFRPDAMVTRAEFAKIMVMAAGLTPKASNYSSYTDITTSDWCSPYVETAKDYLTGYTDASGNAVFRPDSPTVREDVAVAVVKLKGYDTRLADVSMIQQMFTDFDGISKSAQKYVALAVDNGLMSGYPDDTFRAQSTITRAEVSAILWRAYQYGSDNKTTDDTPAVSSPDDIPSVSDGDSGESTDSSKTTTTKKYSVETLAKVDSPQSLVTDADNNIYFIYNNKVEKLADNKVTTIADGSKDFAYNQPVSNIAKTVIDNDNSMKNDVYYLESSTTIYHFKSFNIAGLVYDRSSDKVYALGYYPTDINQRIGLSQSFLWLTALFDVNNVSQPVAGSYYVTGMGRSSYTYEPDGLLIAADNGAILYSGDMVDDIGTQVPKIYRFGLNDRKITAYTAGVSSSTDIAASAMLSPGYSIMYKSGGSLQLKQYDLASGNFTDQEVDTSGLKNNITALAVYNDNFYFYSGNNIYTVSATGDVSKYIDNSQISVKDGLPLGKATQFVFDQKGNIIFYDSTNKAIRRINV